MQVHSSVESVTMSPVERTAAWVLNNGQYEEDKEEGQSKKESKHVEKVPVKALKDKTVSIKKFHFMSPRHDFYKRMVTEYYDSK